MRRDGAALLMFWSTVELMAVLFSGRGDEVRQGARRAVEWDIWRAEARRVWAGAPNLSLRMVSKMVVTRLGLSESSHTVRRRPKRPSTSRSKRSRHRLIGRAHADSIQPSCCLNGRDRPDAVKRTSGTGHPVRIDGWIVYHFLAPNSLQRDQFTEIPSHAPARIVKASGTGFMMDRLNLGGVKHLEAKSACSNTIVDVIISDCKMKLIKTAQLLMGLATNGEEGPRHGGD